MRNDKARKYLTCMRKKQPASFSQKFPKADPMALQLLRRLLAFDPKDRPSAEEVCISNFCFLINPLWILPDKADNFLTVCPMLLGIMTIATYVHITGIGRSILQWISKDREGTFLSTNSKSGI